MNYSMQRGRALLPAARRSETLIFRVVKMQTNPSFSAIKITVGFEPSGCKTEPPNWVALFVISASQESIRKVLWFLLCLFP